MDEEHIISAFIAANRGKLLKEEAKVLIVHGALLERLVEFAIAQGTKRAT